MSEQIKMPSYQTHSEESLSVEREPFHVRQIAIDNGEHEQLLVWHPELLGADEHKKLSPDEQVTIVASGLNAPEDISFADYLALIGSDYRYYQQLRSEQSNTAEPTSNSDLLYTLHQKILKHRRDEAQRMHERYAHEFADRDNFQAETRAHSIVFQKLFNDLGVEGLNVTEAERQVDYESGVDEYLTIGENTIAIQRTFGTKRPEKEDDKWRHIPEHPEFGKIPRVYLNEELEDYGLAPNGAGVSYAEQLYRTRRERALKAHKPAAEMRLPPLYSVLSEDREEGMREQAMQAARVLSNIKKELHAYREGSDEHTASRIDEMTDALSRVMHEVREMYLPNTEEKEKPAA